LLIPCDGAVDGWDEKLFCVCVMLLAAIVLPEILVLLLLLLLLPSFDVEYSSTALDVFLVLFWLSSEVCKDERGDDIPAADEEVVVDVWVVAGLLPPVPPPAANPAIVPFDRRRRMAALFFDSI
jgi:hypothetical protein